MNTNLKKLVLLLLTVVICTKVSAQKIPVVKKDALPQFDVEAHRGGRGLMPENTIPAMLNAIDLGVTTLEMDISFTKDKLPIVSHDQFISPKFALKANGDTISKAEEKELILYQLTYQQIKQFDVGKKFYKAFPEQRKIEAHIPLLSSLIDSTESYARKKGSGLPRYNIETKTTPEGDNILHPAPQEFVKRLMDVIISKNIQSRIVIQSFDPRTLEIIHRNYPNLPTSFLVSNKDDLQTNLSKLSFKPTIYSPDAKMVNQDLVEACHHVGIKIIPWTVNDKKQIEQVRQLGVDGLISDYPDRLK